MGERRFVRHIGLHHFAYLRAVAKGLPAGQSVAVGEQEDR